MISVIIPLYNKEDYISSSIKSVLDQTYTEFELIIVNDGSKDDSLTIVEQFKDKRIRIINKENGGVSSARNVGVESAVFEFIAFLDADDLWLPNHLNRIVELINMYGSEAVIFVNNFARFYGNDKLIVNRELNELDEGVISNYFRLIMKKALLNSSCVCLSKTSFNLVGGFNTKLKNGEDIDMWVRLARKFKIAYSPMCTSYYNIDTLNNSSSNKEKKRFYSYYISFSDCINIHDFLFHLNLKIRFIVKSIIRGYK